MPIKTIEIMCAPCHKCKILKKKILQAVQRVEIKYKIKMSYEFKETPNLQDISKYGLNPSQAPVVIINGKPEFAGNIEITTIPARIEALHKSY
ncbi:MAG: thioredoxin family protein [Candidatus Omnitrophota bacterium]